MGDVGTSLVTVLAPAANAVVVVVVLHWSRVVRRRGRWRRVMVRTSITLCVCDEERVSSFKLGFHSISIRGRGYVVRRCVNLSLLLDFSP